MKLAYIKFKTNIQEWYDEMDIAGLLPDEVTLLEKYLLSNFGCCVEQEDVMELCMDEEVANFDVIAANKLRKGISKKVKSIIEEARTLFFEEGLKAGTRREMLDYVWDHCIKPQLGYSFNKMGELKTRKLSGTPLEPFVLSNNSDGVVA